ncbi:MAG: hypothetical protein Fur007_14120 [Rhodoferax sp.]
MVTYAHLPRPGLANGVGTQHKLLGAAVLGDADHAGGVRGHEASPVESGAKQGLVRGVGGGAILLPKLRAVGYGVVAHVPLAPSTTTFGVLKSATLCRPRSANLRPNP